MNLLTKIIPLLWVASSPLHAGNPPVEFLDIPWGVPAARAKEIMLRRPDTKIGGEAESKVVFEGGTFAGYVVRHTELGFTGGVFSTGTVSVDIPPGNDKNGVPLRNLQFEKMSKSLTAKYGKTVRSGDGNHTEENWKWAVKGLGNEKRLITLRLSYSWNPYEFLVTYSNQAEKPEAVPEKAAPAPPPMKLPTPKKKDL